MVPTDLSSIEQDIVKLYPYKTWNKVLSSLVKVFSKKKKSLVKVPEKDFSGKKPNGFGVHGLIFQIH